MMAPTFKLDGEVQVAATSTVYVLVTITSVSTSLKIGCCASLVRSGTYSLSESSLCEEILRAFGHFSALFLQVVLAKAVPSPSL